MFIESIEDKDIAGRMHSEKISATKSSLIDVGYRFLANICKRPENGSMPCNLTTARQHKTQRAPYIFHRREYQRNRDRKVFKWTSWSTRDAKRGQPRMTFGDSFE